MVALLFGSPSINSQSPLVFDNVEVTALQRDDQLASSTIQTIYQYYLDNKSKTPSESELRDMPRSSSIPSNMEEIYYDNVWLNIAEYSWLEGDHYSTAHNSSVALHIADRSSGNIRLLFDNLKDEYRHVIDARAQGSFDKLPVIVTKVKNNYYFVEKPYLNTSKADYQLIVDYKDGLLIYENTFTGKAGDFDSFRRFRFAALAIPKSLLIKANTSNMPLIQSDVPLMQFDVKGGGWTPHLKRTTGSAQQVSIAKPRHEPRPVASNVEQDNFTEVAVCAKPTVVGEMLSEDELKSLRPGQRIKNGLDEDLYLFDWLELGGIIWYQGEEFWSNTVNAPVYRFNREGGINEYEAAINNAEVKAPQFVSSLAYDEFYVTKRGNFTFITNGEDGGDRIEYTVLKYDGTMLVFDEYDEVSGIRVRKVCKAIKRVK